MSGLILLAILGFWIFVASLLTSICTWVIKPGILKGVVQLVAIVTIFIVPVMDEIIGGFQFRELCKSEVTFHIDEKKAAGKTLHLKSADVTHFTGMVLPTYKQEWKYADHSTNEELFSYAVLHSDGGWLSRWISFNSSQYPYTFDGVCGNKYRESIFQNLNVKLVNKD